MAWRNSFPDLIVLVETKNETDSLSSCLASSGFDGSAFIPSVGRSGGLFAAWNSDRIGVVVSYSNRQYFHLRCSIVGKPEFFITALYAVPSPIFKEALWNDLRGFAGSISSQWIIVGDFNDIASTTERVGGAEINFSRLNAFQHKILECNLTDLGASGPRFTWRGSCPDAFL
ncbi:hypothetical protein K1719_015882 [Acacia pycnantha]|nr:hypothetical protein K1719_015882 [Acacia pycnantha]